MPGLDTRSGKRGVSRLAGRRSEYIPKVTGTTRAQSNQRMFDNFSAKYGGGTSQDPYGQSSYSNQPAQASNPYGQASGDGAASGLMQGYLNRRLQESQQPAQAAVAPQDPSPRGYSEPDKPNFSPDQYRQHGSFQDGGQTVQLFQQRQGVVQNPVDQTRQGVVQNQQGNGYTNYGQTNAGSTNYGTTQGSTNYGTRQEYDPQTGQRRTVTVRPGGY